jgi:hypothetical protein
MFHYSIPLNNVIFYYFAILGAKWPKEEEIVPTNRSSYLASWFAAVKDIMFLYGVHVCINFLF